MYGTDLILNIREEITWLIDNANWKKNYHNNE